METLTFALRYKSVFTFVPQALCVTVLAKGLTLMALCLTVDDIIALMFLYTDMPFGTVKTAFKGSAGCFHDIWC